MFREVVIGLGNNPLVENVVKRYGMQMGASRFVAGRTLPDAVRVIQDINRQGVMVTLDHLGESVKNRTEAVQAKESYLAMLDVIKQKELNANVSLKLTMMGLALDEDLARRHLAEIVQKAAETDNFVRIDMEDSPYTEVTLRLYEEMWDAYAPHVGVVLQAYLYRTLDDLKRLSTPPRNFRIVKGAYMEPVAVAFPNKADVDENYYRLVTTSLELGNYTAIATHDEALIGRILQFIHNAAIPRDQFEFQMLYGVKFSVLKSLAREGYRTRVYVPYGEDWYAYYVRRIAERPANLLFFMRALADRR
ncbi:Proline dehydrogenase [Sulfobacillus acidophilus TPY]|uniref:proline dehydrogenase n=1 Tax=Sulfobacillus acidophilus (strain ATCC 700253 / DSM 10332 / NAL) TaxID=679936 RepID=G8TXI8_SULAD|nr:Proline dehydrogenase [Sulfobacillus acidophilus TPY]AEW03887.1 L-proline dehydrogenase [Sulfobacillus acidophilus DSM 10332]